MKCSVCGGVSRVGVLVEGRRNQPFNERAICANCWEARQNTRHEIESKAAEMMKNVRILRDPPGFSDYPPDGYLHLSQKSGCPRQMALAILLSLLSSSLVIYYFYLVIKTS